MTKPRTIVTHAYRPKRTRKPARKQPEAHQQIPAIVVTAKKPGKAARASEPVYDGPAPDEVRAFFARMIRPPHE
jgi:hypothetical protein